ncbi:nucleotidyltransferase family protein [Halobacillus hunanensis]|uniref:nucleotidyltransferase family protein n=1 Tax=Halobacillus hunanensis TaxID=578214 RepID=UPI0009A5F26F|nr:nucleotidyltransferase domain-containing protein [Halobacillus hunanensis]
MDDHLTIRGQALNELKELVVDQLFSEQVRVYLFGSWARQEEKQSSDIDIAIDSVTPLDGSKWNQLIDVIENSTIPYRVDVVDLWFANSKLVQTVREEGILWKDYAAG